MARVRRELRHRPNGLRLREAAAPTWIKSSLWRSEYALTHLHCEVSHCQRDYVQVDLARGEAGAVETSNLFGREESLDECEFPSDFAVVRRVEHGSRADDVLRLRFAIRDASRTAGSAVRKLTREYEICVVGIYLRAEWDGLPKYTVFGT